MSADANGNDRLTPESLRDAFKALTNSERASLYSQPHHPKCKAVATNRVEDCDCPTRAYVAQIANPGVADLNVDSGRESS